MSESNTDDNTLISQDDIDKLLNSSSLDGDESDPDGAEEEMGELSQDDIDNLLNNSSFGGESDDEPAGDELVSQDDIDRLMDAGLPNDEDSLETDEIEDEDDLELVSQDDIDRLMNNALPDEPDDLISSQDMEDLEELVSEQSEPEQPPVEPDPEPEQNGEKLINEDIVSETVIDESQGVAIEDNLITQDVIDSLLSQPPEPEAIPEPEPEPESQPEPIIEPEPEPEPEELLTPEPSDVIATDGKIAQEDIDDLLREDDPVDNSDENDLISQDDIDALLKSSEEDDEDIIGNLDSGFDGDDEEALDREESELEDNQVVLEETKEAVAEAIGEELDKVVPATKWYRSKKLMACCMVIILLAASAPVVYFKFFADREPGVAVNLPQVKDLAPVVSQPSGSAVEPVVATVEINVPNENRAPAPFIGSDSGPGTVVLKDFILLVQDKESSLSYLTANVSIDYSDGRALTEINTHLPMYRDIIFDAMGNALGTQKADKITEADLLGNIKEALNSLLPGKYVDRVSFDAFSTG